MGTAATEVSVLGAVPVDDGSVDAAADHVFDLALGLSAVIRTIAYIHVFLGT